MMNHTTISRLLLTGCAAMLFSGSVVRADDSTLKIYLLCGQSNMTGQAPSFQGGDDMWAQMKQPQITSIEYLLKDADYRKSLDKKAFASLSNLDESWLLPRDDVWAVHYDSAGGRRSAVHDKDGWGSQVSYTDEPRTLRPGFGNTQRLGVKEEGQSSKKYYYMSMFGPEMGIGHNLGNKLKSPVFLFKSDRGGTALTKGWRPPSTVARDGGEVGDNFKGTVERFKEFCEALDKDLADDGKINAYGNATGYEICGFVWMQGWNDRSTEQEAYEKSLVDLVHDIRKATGKPKLPAIIVESADEDAKLNAAREDAVETINKELPGSAIFVKTGDVHKITGHYHYNGRAEAYIEIGWRIGDAIIENGYTGTEKASK